VQTETFLTAFKLSRNKLVKLYLFDSATVLFVVVFIYVELLANHPTKINY